MTRSVCLLVNPAAGGGKGKARAAELAPLLSAAGLDVTVRMGSSAQESAAIAREVVDSGVDVLACVGGDGTLNQALPALRNSPTAVLVVPTGTGDDSARAFGHEGDNNELVSLIGGGATTTFDLGVVSTDAGERPFFTVVCAGFDSAVNHRANELTWPTGQAKYVRAVLETLARFKPIAYTLTLDDGEPREVTGMLIAIGNGPTYGGGMQVCVGASPTDGALNVTFVKEISVGAFLRVFPKVYSGSFIGHPAIEQYQVGSIELAGDAVAFADGEPFGPLPAKVGIDPGSLRVVCPKV